MRIRPAAAVFLLLAVVPVGAQAPDDPLNELIEQERIRAIVEAGFNGVKEARIDYANDTAFVEAYTDLAYSLGTADPGVIPLLANEAMQGDPQTFYLATYALAWQATPEAITALYAAVERAEDDDSAFALARKSQLIWALAAAGDPNAVVAADAGRHLVGDQGSYRATSTLEAAAMMTVPDSLAILNKELMEEELPAPEERTRTLYALRAIGRIGHPTSLPALLHWAASDSVLARIEAVHGLGLQTTESAADALFAALHDEHPTVAASAALALAVQLPAGRFQKVAEQLATTSDPIARGALYETLAGLDPQGAIPILARYASASDSGERVKLCQAASSALSTEALDLIIEQVGDREKQAGVCALNALIKFDTARSRRVVVHAIDSPNWPLALTASRLAADAGLSDAVETIRRRLVKREFPQLLRDASERPRAEWLLEQLTRLEGIQAIPDIEAALESQVQATLVKKLELAAKSLRAIRDAGDDLQKWEALSTDEDPDLRKVAYNHLGRGLHPRADAKILARALARVEPSEGLTILAQLGAIDDDESRAVLERVLTSPEYQRPELYAFRDMAAWSARRLGGERMRAALLRSITIRHGRDVRPIIYYALLSGADAIPLIEQLMPTRLRFSAVFRGKEYDLLRRLLLALAQGRSLAHLDLPPGEIVFL